MLKSDLARRIAERHPGLGLHGAEAVCDAIMERLCMALSHGDRVELRDFGSFATKRHEARTARNPKTGAPVMASARIAVVFRSAKAVRKRLLDP